MAFAFRRVPWTSQPQGSVPPARNGIARGLVLYAPGSLVTTTAVIDLLQLANGVFRAGSGPTVVPSGRAVSFDGAFNSGGVNWGASTALKSDSFTWTGLFNISSFSSAYCPIFFWENATDSYSLFVKNDGKLAVYCSRDSNGLSYDGSGVNTIQTGVTYRFTLAATINGPFRAYVNATLDGATGAIFGVGFADKTGNVYIDHRESAINEKWAGWGRDFAYFNRELSALEIAQLHAQPQLLALPQLRSFYISPVSSFAGRSIWEGLVKRFRAPPLPKPGTEYTQSYMDNTVNVLRLYFNQLDEYITAISKFAASGTAPPASGTWAQGDVLRNSAPVELGSPGSRYVLTGWICVAGGTPGTWRELRSLTGN